jgi:hypothetical protein
MLTIKTQSGIGLETLPIRGRRMEAAAVAVCVIGMAVVVAVTLIVAGLRGCAAAPAAANYEALWSKGLYGDELADVEVSE